MIPFTAKRDSEHIIDCKTRHVTHIIVKREFNCICNISSIDWKTRLNVISESFAQITYSIVSSKRDVLRDASIICKTRVTYVTLMDVPYVTHLLTLPDHELLKTLESDNLPFHPQIILPSTQPPHKESGWWYTLSQKTDYRTCPSCHRHTTQSTTEAAGKTRTKSTKIAPDTRPNTSD